MLFQCPEHPVCDTKMAMAAMEPSAATQQVLKTLLAQGSDKVRLQ